MDLQLKGRCALVTGAHRGTGAIIATRLAQEGATVLVHGFESGQADPITQGLPHAHSVFGDITTDAGAEVLAAQVSTLTGQVDLLINNYGTAGRGDWENTPSADWIDMYQKNVLSAQRMIRFFTPAMCERGFGRVVNLGTVGSSRPNANSPHYYAAKGALANLTMSLARQLGPKGITVNLVSPGLIRTAEVEESYRRIAQREGWGESWSDIERHIAKDIPTGRIATREEVADLVVFLCSPLAGSIHAQNIRVDGGALPIVT